MILTTLESIPGVTITRHLGIVSGSTVRTGGFGRWFEAMLGVFQGKELKDHAKLLDDARQEAVIRLKQQAEALEADAVLNIRFGASPLGGLRGPEIYVYGTAVKVSR